MARSIVACMIARTTGQSARSSKASCGSFAVRTTSSFFSFLSCSSMHDGLEEGNLMRWKNEGTPEKKAPLASSMRLSDSARSNPCSCQEECHFVFKNSCCQETSSRMYDSLSTSKYATGRRTAGSQITPSARCNAKTRPQKTFTELSGLQIRFGVEFKFRTYLNCRTYTVP